MVVVVEVDVGVSGSSGSHSADVYGGQLSQSLSVLKNNNVDNPAMCFQVCTG